ncbi:MAG: metallophosphoesterase [Thermostichales cyanobacterium DRC_bins_46]
MVLRKLRWWLVVLGLLSGFLGGMWAALSRQVPAPVAMIATPATPTPRPQPTLAPLAQDLIAKHQPSNPPRGDVRLLVVSDLNDSYGMTDYPPEVKQGIALIPFWQPDLILISGDMVAGQNLTLSLTQLQAMWQGFDTHIMTYLKSYGIPFAFTIGNHDASSARNQKGEFIFSLERKIAAQYWQNPSHDLGVQYVDRKDFPFYYTFLDHDIFYLVWDGSSSYIPPDKQAWVEQALASPVAQGAKMRILIGHLPLYAVAQGRDRPGEVMDQAETWRALLERYRVHTYISGHHHAYYPGQRGKLDLLHMGILGAGPRFLLTGLRIGNGKSLTIVDIWFGDPPQTVYHTYQIPSLREIQLEELPRFLLGHNGLVRRRDVASLSPEEMSRCLQSLSAAQCQG